MAGQAWRADARNLLRKDIFGKCRAIVAAICVFLVLDIVVLGANFYSAFQIRQYAASINLAGRQRTLSQRMTKALLLLRSDGTAEEMQRDLDELTLVARLFDDSLRAFHRGGLVIGGDGEVVRLERVGTASGQDIVRRIYEIWDPYLNVLHPLIEPAAHVGDTETLVIAAAAHARAHDLQLLGLTNDLATELEHAAERNAQTLRWIQIFGFVAALVNFLFAVCVAMHRLVLGDRRLEQARRETTRILATVKEGLFLLDREFRLGSQLSASLAGILQHEVSEGQAFLPILEALVPADTQVAARDYIGLLFGDRVKEALVASLNPLDRVGFRTLDSLGQKRMRYLRFDFKRVASKGPVTHLLVTVQDVTELVRLAARLENARAQAGVELETLLKTNRQALEQFLGKVESTLDHIRESLRMANDARTRAPVLANILRSVHGIKGEAATLGVEMLERHAHEFERELVAVRDRGERSGQGMQRVAMLLDGFSERLDAIRTVMGRLRTAPRPVRAEAGRGFAEHLRALGQRIARDQGKVVEVRTALKAIAVLPGKQRARLEGMLVQLLRNAVTHGVEQADTRLRLGKAAQGTITLRCQPGVADGQFELVVRDDGRGIVLDDIRKALLRRDCDETTVRAMSDRQLMNQLFAPGFSTAASADKDGGHGIGLDIVASGILEIGGRLLVTSRAGRFTEFRISFSLPSGPHSAKDTSTGREHR